MNLGNVLIFGDSYSTFKGYIPEGYSCYYTPEREDTDVRKVSETWWHRLMEDTGSTLIANNSWSGSTICYTGYNSTDCSETSSFLCRLNQLIAADFFKKQPTDTVFVFGGTNDSWANSPIGELQYADWDKEDLYQVLPAICCFLHTLKEQLPKARILCLINTELKNEIAEGMKQACEHNRIPALSLKDIDKRSGHPTVKGMAQIEEQVLDFFNGTPFKAPVQ